MRRPLDARALPALSPRCAALTIALLSAAVSLQGCGGEGASGPPPAAAGGNSPSPLPTRTPTPAPTGPAVLPSHVVVLIQENRSVDNLFNGFPGADTVTSGVNSKGQTVQLQPIGLNVHWDVGHAYSAFVTEFNNGKMNGWDLAPLACFIGSCPPPVTPFAYVKPADVVPYWELAKEFSLADHVLQTSEGSSFPAHQYLIAGQSGGGDSDHLAMADSPDTPTGGCNINHATIPTIDMRASFPAVEGNPIFPCLDYNTIFDELTAKGLSWRYYTPTFNNIWAAPIAIHHIWFTSQAQNIVAPETRILTDIAAHKLANVSYVVPEVSLSDHSGYATLQGPDWIGTVANAIGDDPYYWKNTTVIVLWDDWGGWFDHYATHHPPNFPHDPYEFGFRVPLIAISAYVKQAGYVDHTPRDMTAVLGFLEHVFGLSSLGQRDRDTDDLFPMFNFNSLSPLPYKRVDTGGYTPSTFRYRITDTRDVDD